MTQPDEVGPSLWPEERVVDMRSLRQGSQPRGELNDRAAAVEAERVSKTAGRSLRLTAALKSRAAKFLFFVHRS